MTDDLSCVACGGVRPSLETLVCAALARGAAYAAPATRLRNLTARLRELGAEAHDVAALEIQANAWRKLDSELRSALALHVSGICSACAVQLHPGMCDHCASVTSDADGPCAGKVRERR